MLSKIYFYYYNREIIMIKNYLGGKRMRFRNLITHKKVYIIIPLIVITTIVVFVSSGTILAVPPEKTVEFEGGEVGKIVFSGHKHSEAGLGCDICHPGIFEMGKGTSYIRFKDHLQGNYCFTCHTPQGNCYTCHKKE